MNMRKLILFALLALQPLAVLAQSATPISGLPAATTPLTGAEIVPIVQGGATKKATAANIQQSGSQTANAVLAAPNGSTGSPAFRALVNADLPTAISINSIALASAGVSLSSTTGTSQSVFNNYPGLNWELATGTVASPISVPDPSLKISRTEGLTASQCNNTFNDNECNAGIYVAVQNTAANAGTTTMQLNAIYGSALTYGTTVNAEAVGLQGIGRAVGVATAGVAGAYFEGRYDSQATRSYYYTVGVEARSNNLTGLDAPLQSAGGNDYTAYLASCGAGPLGGTLTGSITSNVLSVTVAPTYNIYPGEIIAGSGITAGTYVISNGTGTGGTGTYNVTTTPNVSSESITARQPYCNAFFTANANAAPAYYGYLATTTSAITSAFMDASTAANSLQITGSHSYYINAPYFTVTGAGGASTGYYASTGANPVYWNMDNQAGGNQDVLQFEDASVGKWQIGKLANNNFYLYDVAGAKTFLVAGTNNGSLTLGPAQNVVISNTGNVSSPTIQLTATTFAALPTCNSASAGTLAYITDASAAITAWHQQVTAGSGANKALLACNGTGWFAFDY